MDCPYCEELVLHDNGECLKCGHIQLINEEELDNGSNEKS